MAYSPGYSGLLNAAFPRIGQHEASSGRRINKQVVQGLLQADLDRSKQFAMSENFRNRQLEQQADQFNQQLDIQKQGQIVGGAGQLLQLPLAYGAAKSAGLLPKGFQLTSPSTWGGVTAPGAMSPVAAGGAQAAVAPAVTGTTAQGAVTTGGGLLTGGTTTTGTGVIPVAEGASAVSASPGLLSTAAPVVGAAGLGYAGGELLSKALDANRPWSRTIKGATTGAAIGSVVPVVGTVIGGLIGGAIGAISSLF